MRRNLWTLILVVALAVAGCTSPEEKVGEAVKISQSGEKTLPAGVPFHIAHGYVNDVGEQYARLADFSLEVDGMAVRYDFIEKTTDRSKEPAQESRLWVYNFPEGLTGTHTFVGRWHEACGAKLDNCQNPTQRMETHVSEVIITFEE